MSVAVRAKIEEQLRKTRAGNGRIVGCSWKGTIRALEWMLGQFDAEEHPTPEPAAASRLAAIAEDAQAALDYHARRGMGSGIVPDLGGCPTSALKHLLRLVRGEHEPAVERGSEVDAWPVHDVLVKLADAADILFDRHDYDGDGYEQIKAARDAARAHAHALSAPTRDRQATVAAAIEAGVKALRDAGITVTEEQDIVSTVVIATLDTVVDAVPGLVSTQPGEDIDPEDLWTDYRTERAGLGSAHRLAFLAGVDAGRRTARATRPLAPAVDAPPPPPPGFAGHRGRVIGEARDGAHVVRLVEYTFPDGSRVPYVELHETHDGARPGRVVSLSALVHLAQNATDHEVWAIGNREQRPEETRPLAPAGEDERCSDCGGTGWYLGDGATCEKCGGTAREPAEDERSTLTRLLLDLDHAARHLAEDAAEETPTCDACGEPRRDGDGNPIARQVTVGPEDFDRLCAALDAIDPDEGHDASTYERLRRRLAVPAEEGRAYLDGRRAADDAFDKIRAELGHLYPGKGPYPTLESARAEIERLRATPASQVPCGAWREGMPEPCKGTTAQEAICGTCGARRAWNAATRATLTEEEAHELGEQIDTLDQTSVSEADFDRALVRTIILVRKMLRARHDVPAEVRPTATESWAGDDTRCQNCGEWLTDTCVKIRSCSFCGQRISVPRATGPSRHRDASPHEREPAIAAAAERVAPAVEDVSRPRLAAVLAAGWDDEQDLPPLDVVENRTSAQLHADGDWRPTVGERVVTAASIGPGRSVWGPQRLRPTNATGEVTAVDAFDAWVRIGNTQHVYMLSELRPPFVHLVRSPSETLAVCGVDTRKTDERSAVVGTGYGPDTCPKCRRRGERLDG